MSISGIVFVVLKFGEVHNEGQTWLCKNLVRNV